MYHKDRGYRRHQRERVIRERVTFLTWSWTRGSWMEQLSSWDRGRCSGIALFPWEPGRLGKSNTICSCWMCAWPKYDRMKEKAWRKLERSG